MPEIFKSQILDVPSKKQSLKFQQKFQNRNFFHFKNSEVESSKFLQKKTSGFELNFSKNFNLSSKKSFCDNLPYKILDAPGLKDDFYLNLLDWSAQNLLAVGLGNAVYLWNGNDSKVSKLCELESDEYITSLTWGPRGHQLGFGTNIGNLQVWDVEYMKVSRLVEGLHSKRIGSLAWSNALLCSGSRDKTISFSDFKMSSPLVKSVQKHKQEICGLKWSFDDQMLASGGNDNKVYVWNLHSDIPLQKIKSHTAAVKAIAWSPHQHGVLASGGGSQDRTIKLWNTLQNLQINQVETDSQVCSLAFSKNSNELVSTHGFVRNQIQIWNQNLEELAELTGHYSRVLYLTMSPDGENIATGAGDDTIRFWNVFQSKTSPSNKCQSFLKGNSKELR